MKLINAFKYAINGIIYCIKTQLNFRIHFSTALIAIIAGFVLKISTIEFVIITICIGLELAFEAINTAIEFICNIISPQYNDKVKYTKDIAAGAVLIVSLANLTVGLIIFLPKIFVLF